MLHIDDYIHTFITLGFAGFGWLLKVLWDAVRDLQKDDEALSDKVNDLQVIMAGDYVKREELREEFKRLFAKLDTIEHKLDRKADK